MAPNRPEGRAGSVEFDFYVRKVWDYLPGIAVNTIYRHHTNKGYSIHHRLIDPDKYILFHTTGGQGVVEADDVTYTCEKDAFIICRVARRLDYRCTGPSWNFWLAELKTDALPLEQNRLYWLETAPWVFILLNHALVALKKDDARLSAALLGVYLYTTRGLLREPDEQLRHFERYISEHIAAFSVQQMAADLGIPAKTIFNLFKKNYGLSPYQYYQAQRVEQAREMLEKQDTPVGEIVEALGYSSTGSFSKLFKSYYNQTPQHYRSWVRGEF